jgi:hypothetical protein
VPHSWSERAPVLRTAEFGNAAQQCFQSIDHLEAERSEKEGKIHQEADLALSQSQADLEAGIKKLRDIANEREWHIRDSRNKELERIQNEMSGRRRAIQARLESTIHGQPLDASSDTNSGPLVEGGKEVPDRSDNTSSIMIETPMPITPGAPAAQNVQFHLRHPSKDNATSELQLLQANESHLPSSTNIHTSQNAPGLGFDEHDDRLFGSMWSMHDDTQIQPGPSPDVFNNETTGILPFQRPHRCCACCGQASSVVCSQCWGGKY